MEMSHADLQVEVKELKECQHQDEWAIFGLLTHIGEMEARLNLLHGQVTAVAPAPVVDLMQEEDEGRLGGPIVLGTPFRYKSPSPLVLDKEALDAIEALGGSGSSWVV